MDDFYREDLLDHYKHSEHRGPLNGADVAFEDDNPLCGDRVRLEVRFSSDGTIEQARFTGEGCVINQATASKICEEVQGKDPTEVAEWSQREVLGLLGISLTPIRLKCALLPLKVLQAALALHDRDKRMESDGNGEPER